MSPIVLQFRYDKADIARAMRAHYFSVLRPRLDAILAILLFAVGIYYWRLADMRWFGIFCLGASAVLLLILVVAFTVIPNLAFRQQPKYRDDYSLTFSPEGVHFRTAHIDSQLQWSLYSRALVDAGSYLLYYGARQFSIIPKRVFQNEGQRKEFDRLLSQNVARVVRVGD